jgi:mono/diheme cytochrome c family protein
MNKRHVIAAVLAGLVAMSALSPASAADVANGKKVFDRWCEGCHAAITPLRTPIAGTYALQQRYQGTNIPAVLTERKDLTPALIKTMVRNGLNVMPRSRKTEISDNELDNIVAYLTQPK